MTSSLGKDVRGFAWDAPHAALLSLVEELGDGGLPLCEEFAEMILASAAADSRALSPSPAAAAVVSEPMTGAESVGALLLATTAARARDAAVDDETLLRTMALATVLVARFDTYLAERGAHDAE
jgi:hypothetical protein